MDDKDVKTMLSKLRNQRIKSNIIPDQICLFLEQRQVISSQDKASVEQKGDPSVKMLILLSLITRKGLEAYNTFVQALEENELFLVACHLYKEEKAITLSKLENKTKNIAEVREQLSCKEEEVDKLKKEKAEALSELEEKKEDIEKLREKLSVRKEEVKKLKEDTTRENDHQQRVVTSQDIQKIVDDVDDITKDLVATLRMPTPLGRNIEEEKTKKRDRIWEVLIKWKYREGYGATLSTLKDVLLKLNQTKAAIKLSEMEELNEDVKHARAQSAKLRDECDQLKEDLEKKSEELKNCSEELKQSRRAAKEMEKRNEEANHLRAHKAKLRDECYQLKEYLKKKSEELKNCSKELKQSRRAAKEMKTKKRIYVRAQSARSRNKLHQFNDNLEEEQRGHKTAAASSSVWCRRYGAIRSSSHKYHSKLPTKPRKEELNADSVGEHFQATDLGEHRLTDSHGEKICKDLGCCWQDLGKALKLPNPKIHDVDHRVHRSAEKAKEMLKTWRDQENDGATVKALVVALHETSSKINTEEEKKTRM